MAKHPIELLALGVAVAHELEQRRAERDLAIEQARAGFLASFGQPSKTIRRASRAGERSWSWALAPVLAVAVALALLLWRRHEVPLSFHVDGNRGLVDAWLAAPHERQVAVDFSDGTALRLERASRARVVGIASNGAKVSLESGLIHAEVAHRPHSSWSFIAGPIHVRVIGTKFDLAWDPERERFTVTVSEGSVGVSGSFAGAERPVRSGESMTISLRDRRLELKNASSGAARAAIESSTAEGQPETSNEAPSAEAPSAAAAQPETSAVAPSAQQDLAPSRKGPQWRELAARGKLREAYAAAESFGFAEACDAANATELLLLGDAARLAGRPDRATTALMALRQRYPTDARRAAAAFVLGKIAFDQRRAYDVAASWFTTCLREQPSGGFAREAAGRLIEAYRSAGNRNAAQIAARDYLARYPNGPHADLARSLLPSP